MTRGNAPTGPIRPQFRCRVCKEFVHGTDSGHCPRCGLASPMTQILPPEPSRSSLAVLVVFGLLVIAATWFLTRR